MKYFYTNVSIYFPIALAPNDFSMHDDYDMNYFIKSDKMVIFPIL